MEPKLKMGARISLAATSYEARALEAVARHRRQILYTVATGSKTGYKSVSRPDRITGAVLLRNMSLRDVVNEFERLKAEGKIAA